jgi:hypothetical protein
MQIYGLGADLVVIAHIVFVVYAVAGAVLVLRWPWTAFLHIPVVIWAVYIEISGGICPLTPLENDLRALAGEHGYAGSFVENYLLPVLYPAELTRSLQFVLGGVVTVVNVCAYWLVGRRLRENAR